MKNNQNLDFEAVTAQMVEQLKPVIQSAVAEAMADVQARPLTAPEAAEYLQMPLGSLYHMTREERIPCHRLKHRLVFYSAELDTWIKSGAASY